MVRSWNYVAYLCIYIFVRILVFINLYLSMLAYTDHINMCTHISAHRFRSFHDFGFVSLDILHVYAEDSGTYTCVARNDLGEAQTSTQIHCERKLFIKYTIFSGFGRRLLFANIVLRTSLLAKFIPCTHKFLSRSAPFLFLRNNSNPIQTPHCTHPPRSLNTFTERNSSSCYWIKYIFDFIDGKRKKTWRFGVVYSGD